MGTGADYTEFQTGHFALDVHEVLPISITNVSGQVIQVVGINLQAIEKASIHDSIQPAANTNIFLTDIIPSYSPSDFRTQIIMSNAGNFSVVITNGGNSQVGLLNDGMALSIGTLYIFDVLVHTGDSVNFQYSNTGGTIRVLRIQEIDASSY